MKPRRKLGEGSCKPPPSASPNARPEAPKIHDLSQTEWADTRTKVRRDDIVGRLSEPQGMDEFVAGPAAPDQLASVLGFFARLP